MVKRMLNEIPELTRMSSKGQLVIPNQIRKDLKIREGDVFAASSDNEIIILKKIKNPITKDDLITLKEVAEAWEQIEQGRKKTMESEEFLKKLDKW